ncbi:MAG: T9SS type A sorting domain-containing protein [Bacteroidia bacterium]|jgi:hypothetical protein
MKRKLLSLAIAGLTAAGAFAQSYYYVIKTAGVGPEYNFGNTSASNIIVGSAGAQTNVLSSAQTLPFAFSFFGTAVTQFKASTSGYITFDVSQTTDNVNNVALPSASAPKSAIFGFWDNLKIDNYSTYPSDIRSFTYGTAPNRVFVVQWRLARTSSTPSATNANVTYFGIRLYESGNVFDVVENYGYGTFSGTIGCQNAAQDDGVHIDGSPNLPFGGKNGSHDPALSDVYTFYKGPQQAIKAKLSNATGGLVSLNTSGGLPIKVSAFNLGTQDISAATINYSVNGGATVTNNVSGLTITKSGGSGEIASSTNFVPVSADAGTNKTVKAWLSNINTLGVFSDTVTFTFFVNEGLSGTKKVMFEEGSGGWCGYCPDGHRVVREMEENPTYAGKFTAVIHHNSDGLAHTESNTLNSTYATGYPTAWIDRTKFNDQTTIGMSRNVWTTKVAEKMNDVTPLNISIKNKTYNASSGQLNYTVEVKFVDHGMPGDLRIHTMIVEDKCRGPYTGSTSTTWTQHNYYSKDDAAAGGSNHPLYNEPGYMVGYFHDHAVRAIPSTAWGTAGVITAPTKDATYTQNYTYQMPTETSVDYTVLPSELRKVSNLQNTNNGLGINKPSNTYIVAFVSYYDNDVNKRFILNATDDRDDENGLFNTGVIENNSNISISKVFPNPTNGITVVDFNLNNTDKNVTIEVLDILGKSVMTVKEGGYAAGNHSVAFDASDLKSGIYFVNIKTSEGNSTLKFVVAH